MFSCSSSFRHASRRESPSRGLYWRIVTCVAVLLGGLECTSDYAYAQPRYEMSFRTLAMADGLSQNTVMDIHQDSQGYLWFATENGLDRYDGYSVRSYRRDAVDSGALANDYIWQIAEDESGDLWLATNGGGIARLDRKTDRFTHFRHDATDSNSLPSDATRALLMINTGLWVATAHTGLALLDPDTGSVTRFRHDADNPRSLPSDDVFALLEDNAGRIWVGTERGLAIFDPDTSAFSRLQHDPVNPYSLSDDRVRALFQDRHGAVWVGTAGGGLNMLDPRSGRFTRYQADDGSTSSLSDDHVRAITEDQAGRLWVGTADGLNVLLPQTQQFQRYLGSRQVNDLTDNYVMSLYQDRGGVLWVGTRTGGVNAWNSSSWEFGHSNPSWLENNSITSFASDESGYWIGTFGGGLHYVGEANSKVGESEEVAYPNLSDNRVMALFSDDDTGLWVGTMNGGVEWLPHQAESFVQLTHDPSDSNSLGANGVMSIFKDSNADMWFGTFGGGVTRFNPGSAIFTRYLATETDTAACGVQGRVFAQDNVGGIWVGTENGLCRIDPTTGSVSIVRHDPDDAWSLAENSVYALYIDPEDRLWVGTGGGGLSEARGRLEEPSRLRFVRHSRSTGLASDTVYAVLPGRDGFLWLSGNNGITRFNPRSGESLNFSSANGLQGEEFHFGAAHGLRDGRLLFGGANGYNLFDPRKLGSKAPAPKVALTAISVMNQPLSTEELLSKGRSLALGYRDTALTFEFAALDFMSPGQNQYAYKLDGFDSGWVDADSRRVASYTNLPGGDYTFRVKAAGSNSAWNDEALAIDVSVDLAPWKTPLAYVAYVLLAVGLVSLYVRAQHRKLQQEANYNAQLRREVRERTEELEHSNEQLQRLSQAKGEFLARMSHEIRSPMNGVLGMAEMLVATKLEDTQKRYARTILSSAGSLLQIIEDILDYSKLDSGKLLLDPIDTDLEQMIDDTLAPFELEVRKKGIRLVSSLPPGGLPHLMVDTLRLRQVLVNLLSNAIKFTVDGSVGLNVAIIRQDSAAMTLRFSVKDTGIGIAPANQAHIFESFSQEDSSTSRRFGGTGLGLAISREIVELMRGELALTSAPGEGSEFFFELPLEKAEDAEDPVAPSFDASVIIAVSDSAKRDQLEAYLSSWGMRAETRTSGYSLLDAFSGATAKKADLLVVDARLQDMTGEALVRRVHKEGLIPSRRIVLLSDSDDQILDRLPADVNSVREGLTRSELLTLVGSILRPDLRFVQDASPGQSMQTAQNLSGRVLLVEDNQVNQEVMAAMLPTIGCSVEFAADGESGVRLALSSQYDAVLMDYRLPDIDGVEATRRIRTAEGTENKKARVPIIAFTANAAEIDRQRCREGGMDDFLPKPCSITVLAETLGRWMPAVEQQVSDLGDEVEITAASGGSNSSFDDRNIVQLRQLRRPDGSDLLSHAVDVFFRTAEESVVTIEAAVRDRDAQTIRSVAHRMKSGCDNLGALSMANVCRELEKLGQNGDVDAAAALIPKLRIEHAQSNAWLEEQVRERA